MAFVTTRPQVFQLKLRYLDDQPEERETLDVPTEYNVKMPYILGTADEIPEILFVVELPLPKPKSRWIAPSFQYARVGMSFDATHYVVVPGIVWDRKDYPNGFRVIPWYVFATDARIDIEDKRAVRMALEKSPKLAKLGG